MTRREPLRDGHGRPIGDLRLSVVDRCNFRCQYCMPADGLPWLDRSEILTFEESSGWSRCFASMGVADLRLTGGEPLVRQGVPEAGLDAARQSRACATSRSPRTATCSSATPRRLSGRASTDSTSRWTRLARDAFFKITRRDALAQVMRGLEAVAAFAEVGPIKVNAIAMRDFTEHEVLRFCELARSTDYQVRFIEFMPLDADRATGARGGADRSGDQGDRRDGLRARAAAARAPLDRARVSLRRRRRVRSASSTPCPEPFCADCNRITPHLRRQASHLSVLDRRNRSARSAARGRRATTSSRADPRRRLAQGAQAPRQRAGLPPAAAVDEPDRRLATARRAG